MKYVFGVTSSVSIYKVLNVVRGLTKRKNKVKVVMTKNATKLVSPILFQALSYNKVYVDNFNYDDPLIHITLAKWGDIFVVIPATANIIGKIANGICDDLVSTIALAFPTSKRRILIPAMNKEMWSNPITQENIHKLQNYGWEIIEPEEGLFASPLEGVGKGRLPNEKTIIYNLLRNPNGSLKGKKVLVTAGATKEYIDDVRFISNDSSGLMGLSLALVSYLEGAEVCLVYGNMKFKPFPFIRSIGVSSTDEMLSVVEKEFENTDILFMASAVADFKPSTKLSGKIAKDEITSIELVKTPDILKTISRNKDSRIIVGFGLGSGDVEEYALMKMKDKNVDLIVANKIEISDGKVSFNPMGNKNNKITIFTRNGDKIYYEGSKFKVARFILDQVLKISKPF